MAAQKKPVKKTEKNLTVAGEKSLLPQKTPEKPVVVKTPEKPVVVKAPEKPVAVKAPEKPVAAKAPEKPVAVKAPEKPVVAKAPEKPVVAKAPEKPAAAKAPEKPVAAKAPEKSVAAKAPEKPVAAKTPKKPAEKKTAAKKESKPAKKAAAPKKPAPKKPVEKKAEPAQKPVKQQEAWKEETIVPKKRVLIVGAECAPFAKTGGLADVIGTLPKELNKLGLDTRVMIPFHRVIKEQYRMQTEHVCDYYIRLGGRDCFVGIEKLVRDTVTFYFVDNEDYFNGPIYRGGLAEGEQYAFFARAVVESLDRIGFLPDVVHLNDWHTGMIPILLRTQYGHWPQGKAKTVFTIHNMMYQGQFGFNQVRSWLGIDPKYNTPEFMENYGCVSFMKAALVFADRISTVSPTYAQEIRMPYYAYQLEGILNARANDTWGIVNGINTEEFDPESDLMIAHHFGVNHPEGKLKVKEDLLRELGLNVWNTTPLLSMVTRLTSQKGIDLLMQVFDELMQQDVSVVVLGNGDKQYEDFLRYMEGKYKGRVCAYIGYNNEIAHRIYAGSDLFLMPSKFEPCGISQMIAQRYGTLPIVRETGGLKDTVVPYNEYTGEGNGFSFHNYSAYEMLNIIKYALWVIRDEGKRVQLVKNAMNVDNSFANSAKKYYDMFMGL